MKHDWIEVQRYYDDEHTWAETISHFGMSSAALAKALHRGEIRVRSKSEAMRLRCRKYGAPKHSEETKLKNSRKQRQYLATHPDKVPYLMNHSSRISYPEKVFKSALERSDITGWTYAYRNGIYEYDFAFIEKLVDVEIDGGTHLSEAVKLIDRRRDAWSKSRGWTVVRFPAYRVKNDVESCISELKRIL